MNKKIKRFLLAMAFSLSVLILGSAVANMQNSNALADRIWGDVTFEESYLQGDTLNVPDRILIVDGKEFIATATVTFPDGATTTSDTVKLTVAGKYLVTYTALVNGKVYSQVETVVAQYRTATCLSENSVLTYGAHALSPDINGLQVHLEENDTLYFNQVIDLAGFTASDVLMDMYVTADTVGTVDFNKLFVQLTDVEDEDTYIQIRCSTPTHLDTPFTYVLVGAQGQPLSGWEEKFQTLHVANKYGTPIRHSFTSSYFGDPTETGKSTVRLSYDVQSKSMYVNNLLIADLDNPKYFETIWDGFKSNRVRISIWAEEYVTSSANFVITKLANVDLSNEAIEEKEGPVITVNTDCTEETMPVAKLGMAYPIPTASAYDEYSGICSVRTSVYYGYASSQPSNVAIKDGAFTPTYKGSYAIVYESEDFIGNVSKRTYWVNATNEVTVPIITLNETLPSEINAGELLKIPDCMVSGGSGDSNVKIYVIDGKDQIEVTDSYRFQTVGSKMVKYVATDYLGQKGEYTETINVKAGTAPVFVDELVFPRYLIAGAFYYLPALYANDYTSGTLVRKLATVKVADADGSRTIANGEQYVPSVVNNMDKTTIVYDVDGVTKSYVLPVIKAKDEKGMIVGNYFDTIGASVEMTENEAFISATDSNGEWTFGNALIVEGMLIVMQAMPEKSNYDGINITLTDMTDPTVQIVATLLKNGDKSIFKTDTKELEFDNGFTTKSNSNSFKIGFKNNSFRFNESLLAVKNQINGVPFNGFPSGKVYVNFAFINATANEASYRLTEINGQKITSSKLDRVAPSIVVLGERGGTKKIGTTTILPAALAGDTLDPNIIFTVTVTDPNKNVVTATDGTILKNVDPTKEYEIKLDLYGEYKVFYTAKDTFRNNQTDMPYVIHVDDDESPIITFSSAFKLTAKVGELLVIPDFTVTDNITAMENIAIMKTCVAPSGEIVELYDTSNAVYATQAGIYQLRVYAFDEIGNQTLCRVNVLVTE